MALEGYKSNNNDVVYSSKYHVVWTPKYRRPVLVRSIAKRCEQLIRQVAEKYNSEIIAIEIMPDHVHLLCEVDPVWNSSTGQTYQGCKFAHVEKRILAVAFPNTYVMDE